MQILRIIVYYKNYEYPIVFTARTIDSLDIIKSNQVIKKTMLRNAYKGYRLPNAVQI